MFEKIRAGGHHSQEIDVFYKKDIFLRYIRPQRAPLTRNPCFCKNCFLK